MGVPVSGKGHVQRARWLHHHWERCLGDHGAGRGLGRDRRTHGRGNYRIQLLRGDARLGGRCNRGLHHSLNLFRAGPLGAGSLDGGLHQCRYVCLRGHLLRPRGGHGGCYRLLHSGGDILACQISWG